MVQKHQIKEVLKGKEMSEEVNAGELKHPHETPYKTKVLIPLRSVRDQGSLDELTSISFLLFTSSFLLCGFEVDHLNHLQKNFLNVNGIQCIF